MGWETLKVDTHNVTVSKSSRAVGTLALAINEAILNAGVAEDMAACLDDTILEVCFANLAKEEHLEQCQ